MTCNHNWTVRFPTIGEDNPFEFRPITLSLKASRNQYDFCRAKASFKIGEMMSPHTGKEDGKLRGLTPVEICHNGDVIRKLMFRPDWADYGDQFTHLQFHDLQKALGQGTVDIERESVTLREIYPEIINSATNRLIDEVVFSEPDQQVRTVYGRRGAVDLTYSAWGSRTGYEIIADDDTKAVVDSSYAVDFEQITPEEALHRLHKKFRLKSWVNREGKLVIGLPEAKSIRHVTASGDERVLRYKDASISHNREQVQKVIVEGAWVDEPGIDLGVLGWFDEGGHNDAKAMGIATRPELDSGSTKYVKSTKAKKDALPHIARATLKEMMKEQNVGTVEIDPELSGTEWSNPIDISPGDLLHLVPEDEYFDDPTVDSGIIGDRPDNPHAVCGSFVNNEGYLVTEVEHKVSDKGNWQIHVDVALFPDIPINSYMDYFDPRDEEWVDTDEIDGDSLADGWFEDI